MLREPPARSVTLPQAVRVRAFADVEAVEQELLSHPISENLILTQGVRTAHGSSVCRNSFETYDCDFTRKYAYLVWFC